MPEYNTVQIVITFNGTKYKVSAMDEDKTINMAEFHSQEAVLILLKEELGFLIPVAKLGSEACDG